MPAGNHGSCVHQDKYPVQVDEHNYHDSLQACVIEGHGFIQLSSNLINSSHSHPGPFHF